MKVLLFTLPFIVFNAFANCPQVGNLTYANNKYYAKDEYGVVWATATEVTKFPQLNFVAAMARNDTVTINTVYYIHCDYQAENQDSISLFPPLGTSFNIIASEGKWTIAHSGGENIFNCENATDPSACPFVNS